MLNECISGGQVIGSLEDPTKEIEFYPKGNGELLQDLEQERKGRLLC